MTTTQQIPEAVQWAVAALDNQDRRAATLKGEIDHCEQQLSDALHRREDTRRELQELIQRDADLGKLVDQLRTMYRDKGVEHTAAVRNAAHLRRMAEVVCEDEGIALPGPPAEPRLHNTGEFPVVSDPLEPLPPNVVDARNGHPRPSPEAVAMRRQQGVCPACGVNHIPWCTGNADPVDDAGAHRLPGGERRFQTGPQQAGPDA